MRETTAGPVQGYRAFTSSSATKTDTPLQEIPQSVVVITREFIQDQQSLSVTEALQNASGTTGPSTVGSGQNGSIVRGFQAERFVDGVPVYYQRGARDLLVNFERIEVLKGPAGILYAGGPAPIGGIINVVSKLPVFATFGEAGITVGSRGFVSPFFDINRPLTSDGSVLFRMTGQFQRDVPSIEYIDTRSLSLNPTLTFTNGHGTSLTLQGFYSRRDQPEYSGLPAIGTISGPSVIRPHLFPSSRTLPDGNSQLFGGTARVDHVFDDVWSTFTTVRYSRSSFYEPFQFASGNTPTVAPSTFLVFNSVFQDKVSEVTVNPNLQAKFALGPTRNTLLLSGDYDRARERGYVPFSLAGLVDFRNPVFPTYRAPTDRSGAFDSITVNAGLSAQLQSTNWERVHLLAGVRVAHVALDTLKSRDGRADQT